MSTKTKVSNWKFVAELLIEIGDISVRQTDSALSNLSLNNHGHVE